MSYARWSDESDVYVYAHVGGFIDCCGCTRLDSIEETVAHMQWHRDSGHTVPDRLLDPKTYDEGDFVAMCMTYMCREDGGHDGPHTPLENERDREIREFESLLRAGEAKYRADKH